MAYKTLFFCTSGEQRGQKSTPCFPTKRQSTVLSTSCSAHCSFGVTFYLFGFPAGASISAILTLHAIECACAVWPLDPPPPLPCVSAPPPRSAGGSFCDRACVLLAIRRTCCLHWVGFTFFAVWLMNYTP